MPRSLGAQDLLLDLSYSVLRIKCISNLYIIFHWSAVASRVLIPACVTSAFPCQTSQGCGLCISAFQLWFLINWMSPNRQITITRYHPTTTMPCTFGTKLNRILAKKPELNFAHFETWLFGLISCLSPFLVFCLLIFFEFFFFWWCNKTQWRLTIEMG